MVRTGLQFRRAQPQSFLIVDEGTRIRSGALAAIEGVVMRWKNGFDVFLTFERIRRSIAAKVDGTDLGQ